MTRFFFGEMSLNGSCSPTDVPPLENMVVWQLCLSHLGVFETVGTLLRHLSTCTDDVLTDIVTNYLTLGKAEELWKIRLSVPENWRVSGRIKAFQSHLNFFFILNVWVLCEWTISCTYWFYPCCTLVF